MRRAALVLALLACAMAQVPFVVCQSGCARSMSAVFLMDGHACHERASEAHRSHCCGGHHDEERSTPSHESSEESPDESPHGGEDAGRHHLVQLQSAVAGPAVTLPPSAAPTAPVIAIPTTLVCAPTRSCEPEGKGPPTPPTDPVSAADRLLV